MIIKSHRLWVDVKLPRILLRYRMQAVRQRGVVSGQQKHELFYRTIPVGGLEFDLVIGSFNKIANTETTTTALNGVQAVASQKLTEPVATSTFSTPTMTFGEVGKTGEQETGSYSARAKGVGHFEDNRLLERAILVNAYTWTVGASGVLFDIDVDQALRNATRNDDVLRQFTYYRPEEIEVTVRLNTNQFYVGSLLLAMYPTNATGNWLDELSVLDPTTISASCAEAVIKTYKYAYESAWLKTDPSVRNYVNLTCYILNSLATQSADMPNAITVSVWARFKNIQLAYPQLRLSSKDEAQSGNGRIMVRTPKGHRSTHPSSDPGAHEGSNPLADVVSAVMTSPIGELAQEASKIASLVGGVVSLLDKPDKTDAQTMVNIEGSTDLWCSDIPDTNVFVGMYKDRYVDPAPGRLPMSKAWTVSDYARIPGLKFQKLFTTSTTPTEIFLTQNITNANSPRTPLDYAMANSRYWRGSIKVLLQFFASSFTSARFVVQYRNQYDGDYDAVYDNGLARVIDVKGDTEEMITLPWLSTTWWTPLDVPTIRIGLISNIATTDPASDPVIYVNAWVAGGDDIQFAFPRIPIDSEWPWRPTVGSPRAQYHEKMRKQGKEKGEKEDGVEAQSAIGRIFEKNFPPIAENCSFEVDQGLCTNECLGEISSVAKRYALMYPNYSFDQSFFYGACMDMSFTVADPGLYYGCWRSFRSTFFGMWRAAFLTRSGGYRVRVYPKPSWTWAVRDQNSDSVYGTDMCVAYDGILRLTVPQVQTQPFGFLGHNSNGALDVVKDAYTYSTDPMYVAARDDVQFGYPILPNGMPPDYTPPLKEESKEVGSSNKVGIVVKSKRQTGS